MSVPVAIPIWCREHHIAQSHVSTVVSVVRHSSSNTNDEDIVNSLDEKKMKLNLKVLFVVGECSFGPDKLSCGATFDGTDQKFCRELLE